MDTVKWTQVDDKEASALQSEYPKPKFCYVTVCSTFRAFLSQHGNEISSPVQFCRYPGAVYVPENGRTVFRRNFDDFGNNGVTGVTFLLFCSLV
jgi:hypothetical protein